MSDPVIANIIKSGATLWYAPEGTALPDETSVAAGAAWGGSWARMGFTNAPLQMAYEDTRMAIKVQEFQGKLNQWRIDEAATLQTVLAELTAEYFGLLADSTPSTTAAGAGQVGYEALDIGGVDRVEVYAVGFEGIRYDEDDDALPIRFFFPRANFKLNGNVEFSKVSDTYVNLPILIDGLVDPANNGRIIHQYRVTAPASS